jgi:hypothetical protein
MDAVQMLLQRLEPPCVAPSQQAGSSGAEAGVPCAAFLQDCTSLDGAGWFGLGAFVGLPVQGWSYISTESQRHLLPADRGEPRVLQD